MNTFILVVLQVTAAIGTNSFSTAYSGWTTLGEFSSEKACVAASVKLAQASTDARGVKNFQCLSKQ